MDARIQNKMHKGESSVFGGRAWQQSHYGEGCTHFLTSVTGTLWHLTQKEEDGPASETMLAKMSNVLSPPKMPIRPSVGWVVDPSWTVSLQF